MKNRRLFELLTVHLVAGRRMKSRLVGLIVRICPGTKAGTFRVVVVDAVGINHRVITVLLIWLLCGRVAVPNSAGHEALLGVEAHLALVGNVVGVGEARRLLLHLRLRLCLLHVELGHYVLLVGRCLGLCVVYLLRLLRWLRLMVMLSLANCRLVPGRLTDMLGLVEIVRVCRFRQFRVRNGGGPRSASRVDGLFFSWLGRRGRWSILLGICRLLLLSLSICIVLFEFFRFVVFMRTEDLRGLSVLLFLRGRSLLRMSAKIYLIRSSSLGLPPAVVLVGVLGRLRRSWDLF